MHWSPTKLLHRGEDRAQGNAPKHKWSLPPQKRCALSPALPFEHNFSIKAGRKEKGWKGIVWEEKRVNTIQSTALRQRKTKWTKFSQLTFFNTNSALATEVLVLTPHHNSRKLHWERHHCWSSVLEHQYRAAHGERKTSTGRNRVAWDFLVAALSLNSKN